MRDVPANRGGVRGWPRRPSAADQVPGEPVRLDTDRGRAVMLSTVGGDAWDPQVAVGSDSTATVVWSRSDGSNERVQATTRAPNGSWSSPVTLSEAGADAWNPQVAVGSDGAATAVWRGLDGGSDRIQASSRPAKGVWSTPATLSTVSGNVYDPQVAVDPEGMVTAVWSWWNVDHGQVQTASRPPGGTWSRPVTLSSCCEDAKARGSPRARTVGPLHYGARRYTALSMWWQRPGHRMVRGRLRSSCPRTACAHTALRWQRGRMAPSPLCGSGATVPTTGSRPWC